MAAALPPTDQTSTMPDGWSAPVSGGPRRSLRWGVAGAAVLMVHAGALLTLSRSPSPEGPDLQTPVMTVELEPAPPQEAPAEPAPPAPSEPAKTETPPPPEPVTQEAVKPETPPPEPTPPEPPPPEQPPPEQPPPDEPPVPEETPPEPLPEPPPAPPDVRPAVALPPKPVARPRPPKPVTRPRVTEPAPVPTRAEPAAPPPAARPAPAAPSAAAIQSWQMQLVAHLNRYKRYPAAAQMQRKEGVVTVRFRLMPDGSAQAVQLIRSSGTALLDEEALALISRAVPLPRPDSMNGPIDIAVPVQFRLR